jgi:C4-type Zn-finger protein
MITLSGLLLLSLIINCLLFWYTRKLLEKLSVFTEGVIEFRTKLQQMAAHLESVHQLEMFYGEPILQRLIEHMKLTVIEIKMFSDSFIISEGVEKEELANDEEKAE